ICNQIKVTLSVADLDITDPVPLVRQGSQCLRENLEFIDSNCWFAGFREKAYPLHAKEIPDVQQLKYCGLFSRKRFQVDIHLEPASYIAQIEKLAFPHIPMGGNPTGRKDPLALSKSLAHFANRPADIEPPPKRIDLLLKQLLQLLTAEREKFVFFHAHQD